MTQDGFSVGTMRNRYPLEDERWTIGDRTWVITAVQNQEALLKSVETDADLENFPYGLMLWASAIGLAEWLTENPATVAGKRVLEIGAGIGLVGLVAASLGAAVAQTDYQTEALELCRWNAARNGIVNITQRIADWRHFPEDLLSFPVILASDILYERTLHPLLETLLPRLLAPNGVLILSDPLRPQALEFLERMETRSRFSADFDGRRVVWRGETKDIAIAVIKGYPRGFLS
jgi:predicted nicotinamide N-methyase